MSVIDGGILGKVRGKTAGIVFSTARGRTGKVNTARQFVIPANPQTADQVAQRSVFKRALVIVKGWGPDVYQTDFNRAVQQLPGFQSMMSVLLANVDSSQEFDPPGDLPLGDLHFPDTWTVGNGASGSDIKITWSTETGANGTSADLVKLAIYAEADDADPQYDSKVSGLTRSGGATGYTFSTPQSLKYYIIVGWMTGEGSAEGKQSKCVFDRWQAPDLQFSFSQFQALAHISTHTKKALLAYPVVML